MKNLILAVLAGLYLTITNLNEDPAFDRSLPTIQLLVPFLLKFALNFIICFVLVSVIQYLRNRVENSEGKSKLFNRMLYSMVIALGVVGVRRFLNVDFTFNAPVFSWLKPMLIEFVALSFLFFMLYPLSDIYKGKTA
jgi:hypothetical protein